MRVTEAKWMSTGSSTSRLAFERDRGDRYLSIDGKRAYHLGFACQTCSFLFERLSGANQAVQIESTAEALREGINSLAEEVVSVIGSGLPEGEYCTLLAEGAVSRVKPGDENDYFVKEQIALWGMDTYWCLPHDPRVPYFRAGEFDLGESRRLFNFVVPMFPTDWLTRTTIDEYKHALRTKASGTALALGVLDVRGPADWPGDEAPNPVEHWVLTHYLIDGHHKLNAAFETAKPLRLLTFVAASHGMCARADIESIVELLRVPELEPPKTAETQRKPTVY